MWATMISLKDTIELQEIAPMVVVVAPLFKEGIRVKVGQGRSRVRSIFLLKNPKFRLVVTELLAIFWFAGANLRFLWYQI